jgi:acetyltransferase-like isoleucine patch superfamily enzyme
MLDREPFVSYDTQSVNDRRQCAAMLYHFDNTVDAIPEVVQRMRECYFRVAIDAAYIQPRCEDSLDGGRLGSDVHVVTTFRCDCGHNVSIGPNSRSLDSARMAVRRKTRIGACVIITSSKTPTNMKALKTSYSLEVAKGVYIGENVYVGDAYVVEAGSRVGDGAIIRSWSLVACDIPPDYIACGNPADTYEADSVRCQHHERNRLPSHIGHFYHRLSNS